MIVLFVVVGTVQERFLADYDENNGKYKLESKKKKSNNNGEKKEKQVSENVAHAYMSGPQLVPKHK